MLSLESNYRKIHSKKQYVVYIMDKYTLVHNQNKVLDTNIQSNYNSMNLTNTKVNYLYGCVDWYLNVSVYLFIIYYLLVLLLIYLLYSVQITMSLQKKIIIIVTLSIYPFFNFLRWTWANK
jgi:hypothetical protein